MNLMRTIGLGFSALLATMITASAPASAQQQKPNILVIMGDDIGYWNISAYNRGMMGYRTPNIDRIANEGAIFTDYYGQQSCTAGRAAFITGQSPLRTGLLKVGLPGAKEGLSDKDPTLAELLKPQGYVTGQFGKNHLGDRNEFLPTVHGFDEFFGNLYHLNAEDEPEHPDYPKNMEFKLRFGPRGVLRCTATIADTPRSKSFSALRLTSSIAQVATRSRSSPGSIQPACISGPDLSPSRRKRPVLAFIRMAWWNMTRRLASF
jgi:arylsulfatase A-like enzyme